ncbi:MAG: rod shape-determining protein MreD [Acidobacteria bacterium]|nr:rod shape-determining protein MreD [Acidobacteriota bacterium]
MPAVIRAHEIAAFLVLAAGLDLLMANYVPGAGYLDLPLIAVLYIGWYSSPVKGGVCGLLFGLVQDRVLGLPLGLNGLTKTLVGFSAYYLNHLVMLEGVLGRCIMIAVFSLVDGAVINGLRSALGQPPRLGLVPDLVIRAIVTGISGSILFSMIDRIKFSPADFRKIES